MLARRITIVLGAVVLIGGYVLMNVLAGMKEEPKKMPEIDKTPNVFWSVVKNDTIQNSIAITGRVFSRRKIQVLSEVQGIYRPGTKEFKDGVSFSKSELMLSLEPGGDENESLRSKKLLFECDQSSTAGFEKLIFLNKLRNGKTMCLLSKWKRVYQNFQK